MTIIRFQYVIAVAALLSATACSSSRITPNDVMKDSRYWERANPTDATYMEGPKAQQMLNRDISRCVVELRELERLGALRQAMPGDTTAYETVPDPDTPAGELAQWETPEREGYLRAEHLEYHDFESCMQFKGWERMEYVPYDTAERARADYIEHITGEQYRTKTGARKARRDDEGDWDGLNE
jgi:hypothetical protein